MGKMLHFLQILCKSANILQWLRVDMLSSPANLACWSVLPVSGNLVGTPPQSLREESEFPGIDKSQSDDDFALVFVREHFDRDLQCMRVIQAGAKSEKHAMSPDDRLYFA